MIFEKCLEGDEGCRAQLSKGPVAGVCLLMLGTREGLQEAWVEGLGKTRQEVPEQSRTRAGASGTE